MSEDELTDNPTTDNEANWIVVGAINDKMSADFAKEVLTSYEIPVVVISKSGYFGQAGLNLTTVYKPGVGLFEVSVPADFIEDATEILNMVLGDNWEKRVN